MIDDFLAAMDRLEKLDAIQNEGPIPAKPASEKKRWNCTQCAGTGTWLSRGYYGKSGTCFACKGRGFHETAPEFRAKKKAAYEKAQATKANNLADKIRAFNEENPGLLAFLQGATWSEFAGKLASAVTEFGGLTDRRLEAARSMQAKAAARKEAKQAERTTEIDLAGIFDMFDRAAAAGLKRRIYRAKGLTISPAKEGSANAGGLYVKTRGGEYLGKVMGSKFIGTRAATDEHRATLAAIAVDPSKVARDYGKETGECCVCGAELTDPVSVANGIGPYCARGWGL